MYLGDEDAEMAAAIGASLDAHEALNGTHQGGSTRGPWGSSGPKNSAFFTDEPFMPRPTAPTAPCVFSFLCGVCDNAAQTDLDGENITLSS